MFLRQFVWASLCALTMLAAAAMQSSASAQPAAVIETEHVRAEIALRDARVAPGETVDVAIHHTLADGWHTYWLNPGDSGEAPIVEWSLPQGGRAGELAYPPPEALPYPPLVNYGFKGEFTLLTDIAVPQDWPTGEPYPVTLRIDWLVCEEICIPEGGSASFQIETAAQSEPDSSVAFTFVQAERALPERSDAAATYSRDGDTLYLTVPFGDPGSATFFSAQRDVVDPAAEQRAVEASDGPGMTLALAAGRGRLDGELSGVLRTIHGAWWITAKGEPDPAPAAAELSPPSRLDVVPSELEVASLIDLRTGPSLPLLRAILFAFLGGLILNLMPCVFPVLALKALGLIQHADAPFRRRAAIGGAYAGGVLVSFAVLAAVLLGLKATGVSVGWGFQLQTPAFVLAIALVIFAVGLNLSGVFHVGSSLTRLGAVGPRDGLTGSFATGALATLVATPCSAPFMAVAIGTALASSTLTALAVFAALGVGLAAPFVLLTLIPGLSHVLPRPGVWMERLKQALAFPLYATAVWLVWVLAQLIGANQLLPAMVAFVALGLAAWLFGLAQRGVGPSHKLAAGLAIVSLVGVALAGWPTIIGGAPATIGTAIAKPTAAAYTPARLAELRGAGEPVFVNVTAAWCITCKVNEEVVFANESFDALLGEHGVTYLEADWTRRDPDVTRFLEQFGRAGVPLYVHFPRAGGAPQVLPQILTVSALGTAFATP